MIEVAKDIQRFTGREAGVLVDLLRDAFSYLDLTNDEGELFQELIDALDNADGIEITDED